MPSDSTNGTGGTNDLAEPLLDHSSDVATTNQPRPSPSEGRDCKTMTTSFKAAVSVAVLPMFLFGYSTGVMNAPESVIFPSHTMSQWSVAVSAFCIGGILGANVSGRLADRFGRQKCLLCLGGYLNLVAGIAHVLAPNMLVLTMARILAGVAGGAATVLTPMYLGEISPKEIRGSVGTMTQLSCVVGIMASILMALPFCTDNFWRMIFVPIPVVSALFILASQFLLPESPRWLLLNHYVARGQEARETLRRFRNFGVEEDDGNIEMEVELLRGTTLREEVSSPESGNGNDITADPNLEGEQEVIANPFVDAVTETKTFRSFVSDPKNRIPLISSLLFPITQQLSGVNAVFYYSTSFFQGVIDNPQNGTIAVFFVNLIVTMIAVVLMDRFGRKTLLSWSTGGMLVCCILLTLALKGVFSKAAAVLCVLLYVSFFEIGLGCIPFFIASEVIEAEFLGTVQSITMSINWICNFFVGMAFPYMDKYLGAYSFMPFATVLLGAVIYSVFVLPETRGKSLEELMIELENRQVSRQSHQPVALSPEAADTEIV